MSNADLINAARQVVTWNQADEIYGDNDDLLTRLADALEAADVKLDEIADIALGLDYASDHARVQALVLLFGGEDE